VRLSPKKRVAFIEVELRWRARKVRKSKIGVFTPRGEFWGGRQCGGSSQRGDSCSYEDPSLGRRAFSDLVCDMNEYRNKLYRHRLNRLSELEGQPPELARFGASFKAGWQEWKKRSEQREESSRTLRHCNKRDHISWTLFF